MILYSISSVPNKQTEFVKTCDELVIDHENVVRYYNSWIEVTPAEDLDLDSDETDEESSFAYQAHDKSLSLRFLKII